MEKYYVWIRAYSSQILSAANGSVTQPSPWRAWRESSSWSEHSKTLLAPCSGDKRGHGAPFRVVTPATDCKERTLRSRICLRSTTCVSLSRIDSHLEQERAKHAQGKRGELSSGRNCFPGVSVCVAMAWATGPN
jgi:hypothetical protein